MADERQTSIRSAGDISARRQAPRRDVARRAVDRKRLLLGALLALGVAAGTLAALPAERVSASWGMSQTGRN